ncbi:hypothetical protein IWQ57_001066, partial [Coemansia nantahalensis]
YRCIGQTHEKVIMFYLFELYDYMVGAASTVDTARKALYRLHDHQTVPVPGSGHKPDGVFCYRRGFLGMAAAHVAVEAKMSSALMTINHPDFGQVADYACAMWEAQPTRTFAPVIFLHGVHVTLVLFTRGKWYTVELGCLLHRELEPDNDDVSFVQTTMMNLWFLVTLTPDRFGHFCDVRLAASTIRFAHEEGTVMTTASVPKRAGRTDIRLTTFIPRPVPPRSRCTFLYKTTYNDKPAVLKLSWTQTNRLPESAVYDILVDKEVTGIPEVYDRGLLKTDFFGFRLEYLVLEDCGDTLDVYLRQLAESGTSNKDLAEQLSNVVEVVTGCIVAARAAGVLHRDVSLGNVAVSNRGARLLDWGYGKVVESSDLVEEMAKRWMFDAQEVMTNEAGHDPITGTVHYTGIRVLMGVKTRGYLDDIESLFYVVLHAISRLENGPRTYKGDGFNFVNNRNLAEARVGVLGLESDYHEYFDISVHRDTFRSTLDAMHKFLFWSPAGYTGHQLMHNMEHDRLVDMQHAAKFMNEDGLKVLGRLLRRSDDAPQPHAAMSTTSEPMMTRAAVKKAKTAGKKTEPVNKKPKTTNKENDA